MNQSREQEWNDLRAAQAELRRRLDELEARINALGAAETGPVTAPPPLPKTASSPSVASVAKEPPAIPSVPTPPPTPLSTPKDSLEMRVGTYWLVRIGVVLILTGLVFLGNYVYKHYIGAWGPAGKLALLTLTGAGLSATGAWLERWRAEMKNYGRVLLAGGLAALYYTAYAAHFVPALRVIGSPLVGGLLLLAVAGGIVWLAERRRAPGVIVLTALLAFYTGAMNPLHVFSLFSNLVLTLVAGWFFIRHGWAKVGVAALVGSYLSFGFWRLYQEQTFIFGTGLQGSDYWLSRGFLLGYWLVFTAAAFLGAGRAVAPAARAVFLTFNNAAFFTYVGPSLDKVAPGTYWIFCVVFGLTQLGLYRLSRRLVPADRVSEAALLAQGIALLTLGLIGKLTGHQLPLCLGVESVLLLWFAGRVGSLRPLYYAGSVITAALAVYTSTFADGGESRVVAGTVAAALAALFAGAAWLVRWQRDKARDEAFDLPALLAAGVMTWFGLLAMERWWPAPMRAEAGPFTAAFALVGASILVSAAVRLGGAREAGLASRLWLIAAAVLAAIGAWQGHPDEGPRLGLAVAMGVSALVWRLALPSGTAPAWRWVSAVDLLLALGLYCGWVWDAVPPGWRVAVLAGTGFALALLGWAKRWGGALGLGALVTALAVAAVVWNCAQESSRPADWLVPALLLAALPAGRALTRRHGGSALFTPVVAGTVATVGALLAFLLTRDQCAAPWLTVGWTGLGFALFALGFALRERALRLAGLGMLGAALARVFVRDVWQLETLGRIISFLALGAGLLALGFVYNRYRENIQRWL